jgi:hypothetical protein
VIMSGDCISALPGRGGGCNTDFVQLRRMIMAWTSLRMVPFELCSRHESRIEGYAGTLP